MRRLPMLGEGLGLTTNPGVAGPDSPSLARPRSRGG
jgi:hypothetical protein